MSDLQERSDLHSVFFAHPFVYFLAILYLNSQPPELKLFKNQSTNKKLQKQIHKSTHVKCTEMDFSLLITSFLHVTQTKPNSTCHG